MIDELFTNMTATIFGFFAIVIVGFYTTPQSLQQSPHGEVVCSVSTASGCVHQ